MPALIGGFGKINRNIIKKYYSSGPLDIIKEKESNLREKLGPYLAGLIEAEGSIAVHDANSKSKKYRPKILVVFNLADEPLALKLASVTNTGAVYRKVNAGCVIWHIQKSEEVILIINLINGFMRTPKIEALHRAINWFNTFENLNLTCLGLDKSPINSNAWLAGFSDGDANFSITLTDRKKRGGRVLLQFILNSKVTTDYSEYWACSLPKSLSITASYFLFFSRVCGHFQTSLNTKIKFNPNNVTWTYKMIVHNYLDLVVEYFDKYPLQGHKKLNYEIWREIKLKVNYKANVQPDVYASIRNMLTRLNK